MATRQHRLSGSHSTNRKASSSRTNTPLITSMGSPAPSSPDDDRLDADTILVAELRGRSLHASEPQVKSHLKQEAETVTTKPENRLVYANTRGFGILERLELLARQLEETKNESRESKSEIKELRSESRASKSEINDLRSESRASKSAIAELRNEKQELQNQVATQDQNLLALEGRVKNLTFISEGYLQIRMRFLDNYNKSIKRDRAFEYTTSIEEGNARAHGGDAVVDATLFRDNRRPWDPDTFEDLYGVSHSVALRYADDRVYRALNVRATQIMDKRPFSVQLELAFMAYLGALNQQGGQDRACNHFWKLYNKEYRASE